MGWVFGDIVGIPRSSIEGVDRIVANINRELGHIEGGTIKGFLMAAAKIHQETEKGDVVVPVDLGNLRHSWFVVGSGGGVHMGRRREEQIPGTTGGFVGPQAAEYSAGHTAMLSEMKGKADMFASLFGGPFVILGYSVNYAMWVHEMVGAKFQRKRGRPADAKWFQKALNKHKDNIVKIIEKTAKIV